MKIISGKYKSRIINGYDINGTRPTMDRVRESLIATIYPYLKDAIVLDLFAGTGSLGLEAISNGAKEVTFVDINKKCLDEINKTINSISIEEKVNLINNDYITALKLFNKKFDLIFLDPPYHENKLNEAIKMIEELDLLNKGGIIVSEYEEENPISNYELIKEKKYGLKHIKIFKKTL